MDAVALSAIEVQMVGNPESKGVILRWPLWLGVVCEDFELQRRFYRDSLGLSERRSGEGWVAFEFGHGVLELLAQSERPEYDRRRVSFAFEVDDVHTARDLLVARGIQALSEIEGGPEVGQYWVYFADAEGNLFELAQRVATAAAGS